MSAGWNHILDASITMWPVYITCVAASARAYVLVKSHSSSGYLTIVKILQVIWLVVSTPLKKFLVSWDHYSQYMEKCSKPPISFEFKALVIAHLHQLSQQALKGSRQGSNVQDGQCLHHGCWGNHRCRAMAMFSLGKWWWTKKHGENNVGISWEINNQLNIID